MSTRLVAGWIGLALLIHGTLVFWSLSNSQAVYATGSRLSQSADAILAPLLPKHNSDDFQFGCIASDQFHAPASASLSPAPVSATTVANTPLVLPLIGSDIPVGHNVTMRLPAAAASAALLFVIALALHDRYARNRDNPRHAASSLGAALRNLIQTFVLLMPIPFLLALTLAFWLSLQRQITGAYLTPAASSPIALLMVVTAFVAMYPLTLSTLRWRRHAAADLTPSQPVCAHCGYDTTGMTRCPECGTSKGTRRPKPRLNLQQRRFLSAASLALLFGLLAPLWMSWLDMLL